MHLIVALLLSISGPPPRCHFEKECVKTMAYCPGRGFIQPGQVCAAPVVEVCVATENVPVCR